MANDSVLPTSKIDPNSRSDEPPARKTPGELRSTHWFGPADLRSFGHRSRAMQMGYAPEEWQGKPVIAIINGPTCSRAICISSSAWTT
jgi:hypothetical protein